MMRLLILTLGLACVSVPAVAQTTDGSYAEASSPSMAAVAKAMHATIRRNLAETAEAMRRTTTSTTATSSFICG
jgi:hypothetical protein